MVWMLVRIEEHPLYSKHTIPPPRPCGLQTTGRRSPGTKSWIRFADGQALSATNCHVDGLCRGQIACYIHQVSCLIPEKQNTENINQGNLSSLCLPPWEWAFFQFELVAWSLSLSLKIWRVTAAGGLLDKTAAGRRGFQKRKAREGILSVVPLRSHQELRKTILVY